MNHRVLIPAVFFIFQGLFVNAQTDLVKHVESQTNTGGTVSIHQSDEIYKALNEHVYYLQHEKGIPGYRIRIYSTGRLEKARELATRERSRFVKLYPDIVASLEYQPPFWKVYVGNFIHRSEALKVKEEIIKDFPTAFIVPYDNIQFKNKK